MEMYKKKAFTIREHDVGINDKIKPSGVLDFFQDIAGIHAAELGLGSNDLFKSNLLWILTYTEFDVLKYIPKFSDEIFLCTWPKESARLDLPREYEIRNDANELLIKGISSWVVTDPVTRRVQRPNQITFPGEFYQPTNYPERSKRKVGLRHDGFDASYEYKVLFTDLDHNGHMNNAKYLDMIYNMQYYEGNPEYKHVEIEFIHEAKLNEVVNIKHYKDENYDCYVGFIEDVVCFEVKMEMR